MSIRAVPPPRQRSSKSGLIDSLVACRVAP